MKKLTLTKGKYTIVDDDDYEYLSKVKWKYHDGYAIRNVSSKGTHRMEIMHRVIMSAPKGFVVDHINGDTMDNRKENLRLATVGQNAYNSKPQQGRSSKYKGVTFSKRYQKWKAQITARKSLKFLGYFADELEAARAYNKAAEELFGEFAWLNDL